TRALIDIAQADGLVRAAGIAARQHLPASFLDQLLGRLRRAGLVVSVRGPRGGSKLNLPAESISLVAIVTAIDGPPDARSERERRTDSDPVGGPGPCAVEEAWRHATTAMHDVMQHTSLTMLAQRQSEFDAA